MMSRRSNYQLEPTELYSLAGPGVPSRQMDELAIYTAVSKPSKNVMTNQLQRPPLDEEIPQKQQQQPTPLDDYYDVDVIPQQQQQPTPNEKPHQQPQQIVPHQEPVKKTQIVIIVMLLLILLALGVLSILVTAALASAGNTCKCGADEMDQKILQIVRNISDEQISYHQNKTQSLFNTIGDVNDKFNAIEEALENSTHSLTNAIAGTSSHLENTTAEVVGNVVSEVNQIINTQIKIFFSLQSISCKSIKSQQPNSPTGYYYNINNINSRVIFCNMGELCGSGGGWTRLAYLNMTDDTENCPSGFRLYEGGGVRACGRPTSGSGSCSSVKFPSNGISYSEICGRVVGYQYGPTDAVLKGNNYNINETYVDGVSITRGSSREHVWTLMAGGSESGTDQYNCPCNSGLSQAQMIPSFIGSHYYCESGNSSPNLATVGTFNQSDPLWDGKGCGDNESPCCSESPDLPWFHRDYGNTTTTDYIELRVCGDEGTHDEDAPVGLYEIYVK